MICGVSLPPVGGGGGIDRSGCIFPPAPVLVARADNNNNKDGCIIVEEIGRRRGEDGKLRSPCLGNATAKGPPACRGGTWWVTVDEQ